jgi:DNA polymerase sigma
MHSHSAAWGTLGLLPPHFLLPWALQVTAYMFGSVPLKTYLPDGDIDLSIFTTEGSIRDTWALRLQDKLEEEQRNSSALFRIGDVQVINAEVRLLKCLVDNIVVDISFNQIGGLCTLKFLEHIDKLVTKDHLFKRSIILVGLLAWHGNMKHFPVLRSCTGQGMVLL